MFRQQRLEDSHRIRQADSFQRQFVYLGDRGEQL
jgi:hypothetical protein